MGVSTTPDTMHLMILVSLAAAATAAPQIVPYEHVEIEAEPYIHQEIEAEPYVHIEPELTQEALGAIVRNSQPAVAPVQFAAPAVQQQFVPAQIAQVAQVAPQQFAAAPVAAGVWTGTCLNNLGQGVACRAVEEPQVAAPVVAATRQQQFLPQQQFFAQQQFFPQQFAQQQFAPQQFAAPAVQARFNGACINNLGAAVPCSQ